MRKFILYIILSLFIAQNVYADIKATGRCIGYLTSKMMFEGKSSITQSNLRWMRANNNSIQTVNKIQQEQKNCMLPNQPIEPCLSGYSDYDAQLFTYFNEGLYIFKKDRYDKAARALNEIACGRL